MAVVKRIRQSSIEIGNLPQVEPDNVSCDAGAEVGDGVVSEGTREVERVVAGSAVSPYGVWGEAVAIRKPHVTVPVIDLKKVRLAVAIEIGDLVGRLKAGAPLAIGRKPAPVRDRDVGSAIENFEYCSF